MSEKSDRPKIIVEPDQRKQLVNIQRRLLLRSGLTLGAVSMLTGCNLQDGDQVDKVLSVSYTHLTLPTTERV